MDTSEYSAVPPDGLAERIRAYRVSSGMTQRELAGDLGVTQQTVARWEQGSPPRRYMLRIIESLLEAPGVVDRPQELAPIIGMHPPAGRVPSRGGDDARKIYVQGCLRLLERGERLPNRVLLVLADELGFNDEER